MRIYTPLNKIEKISNAVFLAGPSPRMGVQYKDDCEWRKEFIYILRKKGFDGDIIDPINRNFDKTDLKKQIEWEVDGLYKSSLIVFWIPRTKEHPALTTNVEFGEWLNSNKILLGFPDESINNDYLKIRAEINNIPVHHDLYSLADSVIKHFNKESNDFFASDTHFSSERTLKFSCRPFKNTKEMDLTLISNWNKKVTMNDYVYFLGDFGNPEILKFLNFKKMFFLKGNYEKEEFNLPDEEKNRVVFIKNKSCYIDKQKKSYTLIHEPIQENEDFSFIEDNNFYLFGHIHRLQYVKRNGINVGIDCNFLSPTSIKEIQFTRNAIENHYDENVFIDKCF